MSLVTALALGIAPGGADASDPPAATTVARDSHGWEPSVPLVRHTRAPTVGPVAITRSGLAIAAWTIKEAKDRLWMSVRDVDQGEWSTPVAISSPEEFVGAARIVPYGRGAIVFWLGFVGSGANIQSRQVGADGTLGPVRFVGRAPGTYAVLWVDSGPDGSLAVAALGRSIDDPYVFRRVPGAGWQTLSSAGAGLRVQGVAVDDSRVTILAVNDDGDERTLHLVTWKDGTWSSEQIGPTDGYHLEEPNITVALAAGPNGEVAAIWKEWPARLVVAYRNAGAEHTEPVDVLTSLAPCDWAELCGQLTVVRDGTVLASWMNRTDDRDKPDQLLVARRDPVDGTWSEPQELVSADDLSDVRVAGFDSGHSIIRVDLPSDGTWQTNVISCRLDRPCGPPAPVIPRRASRKAVAPGPHGSAVLLWGTRCEGRHCSVANDVFARIKPAR